MGSRRRWLSAFTESRGLRAARGTFLYAFVGLVARLTTFFTLAVITHSVAPIVFAELALVRVLIHPLRNIADMGTNAASIRALGLTTDRREREEIVATLMVSRILIATVVTAIAVAAALAIWRERVDVVLAAGACLWLICVAEAAGSLLRAYERHGVVAVAMLVSSAADLAGVIYWVAGRQLGLYGLVLAIVARFGSGFVMVVWALGAWSPRAASWSRYRAMGRFGAPIGVSYLISSVGALDRWLIEPLTSLGQVAAYQLASMAASVVELVELAALMALEPYIYGAKSAIPTGMLDRAVRYFSWMAVVAAFMTTMAAPELLSVIAPPEYRDALPIVPWLALTACMHGLFRLVGMGSGLASRTRPWAVAGAIELAAALVLVWIVTPMAGAVGAGAMRLAAATLGVVTCYRLSLNVWPERLPLARVVAYGFAAAILGFLTVSGWLFEIPNLGVRALMAVVVGAFGIWWLDLPTAWRNRNEGTGPDQQGPAAAADAKASSETVSSPATTGDR